MEVKAKACKGINKAKGFKGCGIVTKYRKHGLCSSCLKDFYLNDERGRIIVEKATIKVQAKRIKQQKDLEKAFQSRKTRTALQRAHNYTKTLVHEAVRLRDEGKNCISCGALWNSDFQAGHFKPAGSYETLKYDFHNINGQCWKCNLRLEGNVQKYADNLPNRIGKEAFSELMHKAQIDKRFEKFWNIEKLKNVQKEAKELIKTFKK